MFINKIKKLLKQLFITVLAVSFFTGYFSFSVQAQSGQKLTGKTAMEITGMMGKGWNLGNTFDAVGGNKSDIYSQEQSWGNPKVTKELIDGVKAAGFTTIRIPITWYRHIDKNNNYHIDEAFLARVTEVVDYAFDNELFVIINVHHETWVNSKTLESDYEMIGEELAAVWSQIADNFAEYDQHLIFEGMNEPRAKDTGYEWSGNTACYNAINYLNQIFVETVRSNGKGHNKERALMIPGYAAGGSTNILRAIEIPKINGSQAENIIISAHCYSPYSFCLSDEKESFDPNNSADTGEITAFINNLNSLFISRGIPVVIGECGATNTNDNTGARKAWCSYFSDITRQYGIPAVLWDNGAKGKSGGECHKYFARKTGEVLETEIVSAFLYGDIEANTPKDLTIDFEPYKDGGNTVLASPEQYGFYPKSITKLAKVNHTEEAAVGFCAVISKDRENSYATMDLSKYAGTGILIKCYISSKSNDTVSIGIIDGGEVIEKVSSQISTEWTEMSFACSFSEEKTDRQLYFKGAGADDFYLDDITVTLIGDEQFADPQDEQDASTGKAPLYIISGAIFLAALLVIVLLLCRKSSKKK